MNKEGFCTYEQARLLKQIGFDWECFEMWTKDFADDGTPVKIRKSQRVKPMVMSASNSFLKLCGSNDISAPTLAKAANWFREELGADLVVGPRFNSNTGERIGYFWYWAQRTDVSDRSIIYPSYDEALSAGISAILKNFVPDESERM